MTYETMHGYKKVEGIRSLHLHFTSLWDKKEKMRLEINTLRCYETQWKEMRVPAAKDFIHSFMMRKNTGEPDLAYNVFYKIDRQKDIPKFVVDYPEIYLYNTAIKELLCAGEDASKIMANWVAFILYYYRFFKSDSLDELYNATISDIADVISLIIKREYTKYKNFNTANAINALRKIHLSERLIKMGEAPRNINFRRKYK